MNWKESIVFFGGIFIAAVTPTITGALWEILLKGVVMALAIGFIIKGMRKREIDKMD